MEIRATYKYVRMSAYKVRQVTREIQGLPTSRALDILSFTPKKAAELVKKTLKSAIANAENNNDLRADSLYVKEAIVGEAPTLKRFTARARGSGSRIRKRNSHIFITLSNEGFPEPQAPKRHFSNKKENEEKVASSLEKVAE